MNQIKIFIELTRLNKPIGYMLLFWPCAWGLTYAHHLIQNKKIFIYNKIIFYEFFEKGFLSPVKIIDQFESINN